MKQNRWPIATTLGALIMLSSYQNCSTSGFDKNPYYATSSTLGCDSLTESCPGEAGDASTINLKISNPPPYTLRASEVAFDLAGDCGAYGFAVINVHWTFQNQNFQTLSSGMAGCDSSGRWRVTVPVPPLFDYKQTYLFTAEAFGRVTASSPELGNPDGTARKVLQVIGETPK